MSTWAIGDVQGCYASLEALLDAIAFDRTRDRLWFAGDLVNRGPRSADVLRFARDLGDRATCVLGNHDLNLLAAAAGLREPRERDTIRDVLDAPDADDLVDWLRRQSVVHLTDTHLLVHAGLLPAWSTHYVVACARKAERRLRGDDWIDFLRAIYVGGRPQTGAGDAVSDLLATVTYVRCVGDDGMPFHGFDGPPEQAPPGTRPWWVGRRDDVTLLFGHWAALGFRRGPGWIALDSGCVWGAQLTAVRLEDDAVAQVQARE